MTRSPACRREMQEKAAEDAVESMNAEQELYTLAQMPHNMSVALATTYDSSGWPHDRSPFLKARSAAGLCNAGRGQGEGLNQEAPLWVIYGAGAGRMEERREGGDGVERMAPLSP